MGAATRTCAGRWVRLELHMSTAIRMVFLPSGWSASSAPGADFCLLPLLWAQCLAGSWFSWCDCAAPPY
eukprot:11623753-Alexandrium_andersonii.AAC.1